MSDETKRKTELLKIGCKPENWKSGKFSIDDDQSLSSQRDINWTYHEAHAYKNNIDKLEIPGRTEQHKRKSSNIMWNHGPSFHSPEKKPRKKSLLNAPFVALMSNWILFGSRLPSAPKQYNAWRSTNLFQGFHLGSSIISMTKENYPSNLKKVLRPFGYLGIWQTI